MDNYTVKLIPATARYHIIDLAGRTLQNGRTAYPTIGALDDYRTPERAWAALDELKPETIVGWMARQDLQGQGGMR